MMDHINKLRRMFDRHDKILLVFLFLMMLVGAVIEVLGVGVIPLFITAVAEPEKLQQIPMVNHFLARLGVNTPSAFLLWGGIVLLLVFSLRNTYLAFLAYAKVRFIHGRFFRLTRRLFAAYMQAPYAFHLRRNSSELLRNCQQETQKIVMGVIQPALEALLQLLFTIGLVVLLLVTSFLPALITILSVGLAGGLFVWMFQKKSRGMGIKAMAARGDFIRTVQQGLGGIKEVRVLHRETLFINRLAETTGILARTQRFQMTILQIVPHITELVGVLTIIGIAFLLWTSGATFTSISAITAMFAAAFFRLKRSVSVLINSAIQFKYTLVSIDPVYDDLQALSDHPWADPGRADKAAVVPMPLTETLTVKDLWYRYNQGEAYVLAGIQMDIPRGSSVALVGPTGSGKSTLVDLLLGLLEPESGLIQADGRDIQSDLPAWQANIGYIPQTIYLLDDTIRRNVALALPDDCIDDEKVAEALQKAQLADLVAELPDGVETVVGENGVRLSGGQRQRIGIARAIYDHPSVLVLDEATSSLDSPTEQKIMADVNKLKGEQTVIMIAHRLSTVRDCDCIFFLKDGRITGQGTYAGLIATDPVFRKFAEASSVRT